jgi:hypothetical protein
VSSGKPIIPERLSDGFGMISFAMRRMTAGAPINMSTASIIKLCIKASCTGH